MSLPNNHARFAGLNTAFVQVPQIIQSRIWPQNYMFGNFVHMKFSGFSIYVKSCEKIK